MCTEKTRNFASRGHLAPALVTLTCQTPMPGTSFLQSPQVSKPRDITNFKGAIGRVSIACALPNGYREWIAPPCTLLQESLDNARHDAATIVTKLPCNSGCAVAALPPELLSYVFSMNVLSDRPAQKNLGWISVTQVCHRWREVCAATYQPDFLICVY